MSSFGIAQPFRCPSIVSRMGRTVEKVEKVVEKKPVYDSDNSDRTDHSDHSDHSDDESDQKQEEKTRRMQCRLQFSNIASRFSANKNVDHM